MTNERFEELLEERVAKMRAMLASKGREYAPGEDRLENFKVSAAFLRTAPAEACLGFLAKHLASVVSLVRSGSTDAAAWDEKLGDAVNYLVLLEALVEDARG